MKTNIIHIFLFTSILDINCTTHQNTTSKFEGNWQAINLTLAEIGYDPINDSLLLPLEYHQERIGMKPGSSQYYLDSLALVAMKMQIKYSIMATNIEIGKNGQYIFRPNTDLAEIGLYRLLSKNQIEFSPKKDSNSEKFIFHFKLKGDLLYLSESGEKQFEVVYKRIN